MLLLRTVVFALTDHFHPQHVAVELQTRLGVAYHDRRVVDSEEEFVWVLFRQAAPLRVALVARELQNLQRMSVWVLEVECLDPACVFVPIRQALWSGRCVLYVVLSQPLI